MSAETITISDYRSTVADFSGYVTGDSNFMDTVGEITSTIGDITGFPGKLEFSIRAVQDGLTLPSAVTAALSFAPYGIGTAVRKTADVTEEVTGRIKPYHDKVKEADEKLKPFNEKFEKVGYAVTALDTALDLADRIAQNLDDTAGYLLESLGDGPVAEGSRLEERLDASARFMGDFNDFHASVFGGVEAVVDSIGRVVDQTIGALPIGVIDDIAEVVQDVFKPISDALKAIESGLCQTFTVIPGVPAVSIKVPVPWPPWSETITTPAIPPLRINVCDIIETISSQIGVVQTFVENLVLDVLESLGINIFGAIDRLKDKLLEPFQPVFDLIENGLDRVEDVLAEAISAIDGFFDDLESILRDAIDHVVLFESGQVGDEAPGSKDDVLTGALVADLELLDPETAALKAAAQPYEVEDGLFGLSGDDKLMGLGGDDFLLGGEGDDTLDGGTGDDENYGGNGDDTYIFTGEYGDDFVSDRDGASTFVFDAGSEIAYSRVDGDDLLIETAGGSVRVDGFYEGNQRDTTTIRVGDQEGRINTAPTALALSAAMVAENAAAGTVVGALSAMDADGDTISFELLDSAGGRFGVENGQLVVAGALDYETATAHQVSVMASDGYGGETVQSFTVAVSDVDDTVTPGPAPVPPPPAPAPGPGPAPKPKPEPGPGPGPNPGDGVTPLPTPEPSPVPPGAARSITGDEGDNRFELDGTNSYMVDAKGGMDTVAYAHTRAEVSEKMLGGLVEFSLPGGAVDVLRDVERVELEDGTYLFDLRDDAAVTYRLYAAALGRTPDEGGLRYWDGQSERGMAEKSIADAFVDSIEFQSRFGGEAPSTGEYVDALYTNVLGRVADGGGRDFWVRALDEGRADEADMLMAFSGSAENIAKTEDDYDLGVWVA